MTMIPIATAYGTGDAWLTFSNIPQTYKHLQVRLSGRCNRDSTSEVLIWRINNDSSATSTMHFLQGNGTTPTATGYTSVSYQALGDYFPAKQSTWEIPGVAIIDILDYASTTKYKVTKAWGGFDGNGSGGISVSSGMLPQTTAVTSFWITGQGGYLDKNSRADLYGIVG